MLNPLKYFINSLYIENGPKQPDTVDLEVVSPFSKSCYEDFVALSWDSVSTKLILHRNREKL